MVDDAHGEGDVGRGGRVLSTTSTCEQSRYRGTLSKAFGVVGGYIAGSKRLTSYLAQRDVPSLFSGGVTAADVAACIAAGAGHSRSL